MWTGRLHWKSSSSLFLSPPLNSGLPAAENFCSFSDPFSFSLISVLVYKHLVAVCQIQREDINSSHFWKPYTFICPRYRFFALSFPPRYLFSCLLPLTRQPLPSRRLQFCFSPLCHRSLLQRVAQSRLSDTEMMQKDKTIRGKPISLCLSLFRRLAASDSCPQDFVWVCVRVCVQRWWECIHRVVSDGWQPQFLLFWPEAGSAHQVPTPRWLDLNHLNKHEGGERTHTHSGCTKVYEDTTD